MSKIIVLAEKPSVGRDIARVLQCNNKGKGYLEGNNYIVTWALGHLVTLADPEIYNDKYKSWNIEDLPMIPQPLKLVVIKQTGKQFQTVKSQLNRKDVNEIVIATDAGREGELVARWIIEKSHVNKPIKRLWISSVTDKAIKEGFSKLKSGIEYNNLYTSAVARAEADWIVGINATRALTCKYNAQLSCGRVQTPTLYIIAKREEEIKNFKAKDYYGITAITKDLKLIWQDSKNKNTRIFNKDYCDTLVNNLENKNAKVIDVNKTYKKNPSPKLYDLTELQRDANKKYGYSAKETLSIMQRLYESHKVLTYPRTDSEYITTDIVDTLKDRALACKLAPYASFVNKILKKPIRTTSSFVNDNKVSDHHAIIPTEEKVSLNNLNDKERKIYDLVVKRFLAVLYPPFEYEQISITAKIENETFIAKGKSIISIGWKEVYQGIYEDDDEKDDLLDQVLPKININDQLEVRSLTKTSGKTTPPPFFNEASLLSAMENPAKYMANESKDLIKVIGETGGLGTVATRADIIEKLFNNFLIEKNGKDILITSKGKQLLELVPEDLKSPTLTAEWEKKLSEIAKGKLNKQTFIKDVISYTKTSIRDIKNSNQDFKHDNITMNRCPDCGKLMLEVKNKKGKMLVCQDRDCGYRKGIAKTTNARCPNCHKKLSLHGEGDGKIFVCKCGYREKLSSFNNRKKQEGTKLSKREVSKYINKQNKKEDKPVNSVLADALSKLDLK